MKKGPLTKPITISNKIKNSNPQTPLPPSTPPMRLEDEPKKMEEDVKMEVDHKVETVNIDQMLESKTHVDLNLDDTKKAKKKKEYDLDDTIIRDVTLSNDVHIRLLSNINGYFVDIRRYFRGYPSQKGIRMSAVKFAIAADYLKKDIEALNLPLPSNVLQSSTP